MLLCACQAAILGRREQARFLGEVRFLTRDNVVCEAMCEATVDRDLLGRTHIDFECCRCCCFWPWTPACVCLSACLPACLPATGRHIYHLLVCLERRPGRPCSPTSICRSKPHLEAHITTMSEKQVVDALCIRPMLIAAARERLSCWLQSA